MSTYSEKLKDPRWQRKRLEVLNCFGWQCANCEAADKTLHVHHRYYVSGREPWEYPPICYVALCEECHEANAEEFDDNGERLHAQWWEDVIGFLYADATWGNDPTQLAGPVVHNLNERYSKAAIRRAIEWIIDEPEFEAVVRAAFYATTSLKRPRPAIFFGPEYRARRAKFMRRVLNSRRASRAKGAARA